MDARSTKVYDGMGMMPMQISRIVSRDRKMNPRLYAPSERQHFETGAIIQEIYQQTAARHPELFVDANQSGVPPPAPQAATVVGHACPQCGSTEFIEVLCPTCSTKRVIRYKCSKCGLTRRKR